MAEAYKPTAKFPKNVPCIGIPDPLCAQAGIKLSWARANKFGVHAFDSTHSHRGLDRRSRHAPCDDKVHVVRRSSVLFHPIARKLVAESCHYFLFAQKLTKKSGSAEFPLEVLKLSRQYRSVLRCCLENFQAAAEASPADEKQSYIKHIPTFYNMELVWHLCEIIFIDVLPGLQVLPHLLSWIRFHVPHVDREAQKLLKLDPGEAEKCDNYWIVIIDCLLQRRTELVRSLLSVHSRASSEAFKLIDQTLRTMPTFEVYSGLSGVEFQLRHDCWRKEAVRLQRTGAFSSFQHLDIICKIIVGDESVQDIIQDHCETWYQHMVATLIYDSPAAKVFDLAFYANRSLTRYGGPGSINQLDWILCHIMEMNIYKMVEKSLEWEDSDWLLTHLIHLMHLLGKLYVATSPESGNDLTEGILIDYGTLLMSHSSMWEIGADYLDHCPKLGQKTLEPLLESIPVKNNAKALRIIHLATERELFEVVHTVCLSMGHRYRNHGHLGAALTWAIRSKDNLFCSQIADILLKQYIDTGKFPCLDLLESLGGEMMLGDRLVFLGKYCEFLRLMKSGESKEAAALLVLLFKSQVAPRYFRFKMMTDAMPLLDIEKQAFSPEDVNDFMAFLQELVDAAGEEIDGNIVLTIRTALTGNLASALIQQYSS